MEKIKKIFIICGEPSGDLLAGNLSQVIKTLDPNIQISGVGGINLANSGCEIFYNIKELAVMGLFDVLRKLPKFFKLKKIILEKINKDKPDAVILVDFSGFNLRLAKALNKGVPVIYYVSPQVWASRKGRINYIKKFISMMLVLFKFEEEFYRRNGIQSTCVGHPLLDLVKPSLSQREFLENFRISPEKKIIALLPGSRKQEVKLILPIMLKAAYLINQAFPQTQFIIAKSPNLDTQIYQNERRKFSLDIKIIDGRAYDCLSIAQASLVCSGTATLEAAISQKPFVIIYKTNFLNYLLYRPQIKIPYIGMVNIVAGKKIVPEFIQFGATPEKISESILKFLQEPAATDSLTQSLQTVKDSLGSAGAAERAAKLILDFIYP